MMDDDPGDCNTVNTKVDALPSAAEVMGAVARFGSALDESTRVSTSPSATLEEFDAATTKLRLTLWEVERLALRLARLEPWRLE